MLQTRDGNSHATLKHLSIWGIPSEIFNHPVSLDLVISRLEHLFLHMDTANNSPQEPRSVYDLSRLNPDKLVTLEIRGNVKVILPEAVRLHSDRYAPYYGS